MTKKKVDRISISFDLTDLRERLTAQIRTHGQSISAVIRTCTLLGLEVLEALDERNLPVPRPGQVGRFLDELSVGPQSQPASIPELLASVNLTEFAALSRIPLAALQAYANGVKRPCDRDLVIMGAFLTKPDGSRWETTELMKLCDRNLPLYEVPENRGEHANDL